MTARKPFSKSPPPSNLEALRKLVVQIGRGELDLPLGAKAHDLLAKLVDMPERAAVHTISELAALFDVNASTLTRLAKRLGYSGFSEFQDVFRRVVADSNRYFYSRQAGRLLATGPTGDGVEVFERIARESIANIESTLAGLDPEAAQGSAQLLASARRVRFHGERQFHSFASFAAYALGMIRADVALLDAPRLGLAEALSGLSIDDVVVVSSCAPYTRSVVEVAETAARFGIQVIAITDVRSSPLVAPARHAFFIPHASSFFSNSIGAYMVFAEGLLNLVARELGESALAALAHRETLIGEMGIETP